MLKNIRPHFAFTENDNREKARLEGPFLAESSKFMCDGKMKKTFLFLGFTEPLPCIKQFKKINCLYQKDSIKTWSIYFNLPILLY